ncbi:transglutaminase-like domain-containing protein, partial [Streptomyces sp. NPDC019890]|uniref:transglutaminase-like domain-containing protein n=1 Tax=Streptomyces sp. NPDC019890 TaxID=3365064 RepID=UPI00384B900C
VMTVDHLGPGTTYTVDSMPPARPPQFRLPALRAGSTGRAALDVPPGSPTALEEFTRGATADAHAPYARATAIATRLRTSYTQDPRSPGLPSYGGIARFLEDKQGPPALFATVFALAARSSGLPTRLVVGFTPRAAATDAPHQVRGSDAKVWNEVYFTDAGWVPFDPVPPAGRARSSAGEPPASSVKPRPSQAPKSASPRPADPPRSVRPVPRALPSTHVRDLGSLIAVLCSLLAAALYGARALRLIVLPAVRSRRARRLGKPAERARGAWRFAVDCLGDAGVPIGPSADVTQVSRLMAQTAGPDAVASTVALARIAHRALYGEPDSRENGGSRPYLAQEDADRAWDRSDHVCAALRRRAGRLGSRMWLLVLPRPLLVRWRRSRIGRLPAPALSDDVSLGQTPAGRATG